MKVLAALLVPACAYFIDRLHRNKVPYRRTLSVLAAVATILQFLIYWAL